MPLSHRYRKAKIDCLSLFMCPLLAQLKIGFFSSFSAAAVYSTNETNKAGLKQSIIFRCLCVKQSIYLDVYDKLALLLTLKSEISFLEFPALMTPEMAEFAA